MSTVRQARVTGAEAVASGVRVVRLRTTDDRPLGQRAGQYVLLHTRAADGAVLKRAYSIASAPATDGTFAFCVRRVAGPASDYVHALAPGDEVAFTGPWGKFVIDDDRADLVLVATGTAISCAGAIVEEELRHARARAVRLLWGLREESDVHHVARLERLVAEHPRFSFVFALSRPSRVWAGARGRVTELLRKEMTLGARYYLAGNGAMIAEAEELLVAAGVSAQAVRKEAFFTPGQVRIPLAERQARAAIRTRPGRAVAGLGLHAGATPDAVTEALAAAFVAVGVTPGDLRNLAATAKASDEAGLRTAAEFLGLPVEFYQPGEVEAGIAALGSSSTCEVVARLSAGGPLLAAKIKTPTVTVALATVAAKE